jgi:hypothetical protein
MVKNKFPFARAFGNGTGVPLGPVIIKDDVPVLVAIGRVFAPRFIPLVQHPSRPAQARRGLRPGDAVLCDIHGGQDHPLAGARAVRQYPVFDRSVRGTVRRRMGHTPLQSQAMGYPWQVGCAQIGRRAVAAATVATHEKPLAPGMRRAARLLPPQGPTSAAQGARGVARMEGDVRLRVPHGIDTVRHQLAWACRANILGKGCDGLGGAGRASTVQVPPPRLFFRLDRHHRIARRCIRVAQADTVCDWRVAIGLVPPRLFLARRAAAPLAFAPQPPNRVAAGGRAQCQQPPRPRPPRHVRPQHACTHRLPSGALLHHGAPGRCQGRRRPYARRAAPLWCGCAPPPPPLPPRERADLDDWLWNRTPTPARGPRPHRGPAWRPRWPPTDVGPFPITTPRSAASSLRSLLHTPPGLTP